MFQLGYKYKTINTEQNKRKNCDYEDNNILDVTIKGQEMGAESVHPYTDSFLLHMYGTIKTISLFSTNRS